MAIVNNEKIAVYDMDNAETFKIRVASRLKTLPKYLVFSPGLEKLKENYYVQDILKDIKKSAEESADFLKISRTVQNLLPTLNVKKDILYPWLVYNKTIEDMASFDSIVLESIGDTLAEDGYFSAPKDFVKFWTEDKEKVKKALEGEIEYQQILDKNNIKIYGTFDSIEEGYVYTDFNLEKATIDIELNLSDVSLLEIFNMIQLNKSVPFASCKKYYKILTDFIPSEEWGKTSQDEVQLKVNSKIATIDYSTSSIFLKDNKPFGTLKINTEKGNLSQPEYISRILSVFSGVSYSSLYEKEVTGVFEFPQVRLNTYVFSDLVAVDKTFSSMIVIDESQKATKRKSDSTQPWLYLHFTHPSTGHVTAGITQKLADRNDVEIRAKDPDIFPHGEPYIRVRVRAKDKASVEKFQEMFSKLLSLYSQKYNETVAIYKKYLPDFGIIEETKVKKRKEKSLSPDIFIENYTRNCAQNRMPVITEEDAKKKKSIKFPRDTPEKGEIYPSDGKNQKYYTCTNPEYPYPGLQKNRLANSEIYPYVPCCFKNDQSIKPGSIYRHYYKGEDLEVKETKQQDLIITDKILGHGKYGKIPDALQKLFDLLDLEPGYKYIRMGVKRDYNSFLTAVLTGLHNYTNVLDKSEKELEKFLEKTKKKFTSENTLPLTSQSTYDIDTKNLINTIRSDKTYFEPRLFCQLLEEYYNCHILLFNNEQMFLPKYTQGYYTYEKVAPYVFVYEHWGSESDHAKYPQCEIIVKWNEKSSKDIQYNFAYGQKISKSLRKVYNYMKNSYVLNKPVKSILLPIKGIVEVIGQQIDSYGKTRRVDVMYENNTYTLYTTPIPPLATVKTEKDPYHVSVQTAMDFLTKFGQDIQQVVIEDSVKELVGTIGNVIVSIPVLDTPKIEGIPISNTGLASLHKIEKISYLDQFNYNKKLARYLTEYAIWLYSRYLTKENVTELTNKVLAKFGDKHTVIIPGYEYPKSIPKNFTTDSGLLSNKKLVLTSPEMQKRIFYVLKLVSLQNPEKIKKYHEHSSIVEYYVDISDFDKRTGEIILQGEDAVEKWIQESRITYKLYDEIQQTYIPYFFKNPNVDSQVYLAQNTTELKTALDIAITWNRKSYNPGVFGTEEIRKSYSFLLYNYKNKDEIELVQVDSKKEPKKEIKIIGYKINEKPGYTVLLDL
jgi:hypothetical protein